MSKIVNGRMFYNVTEVADILGTTTVTIYNRVKQGVFHGVRLDRLYISKEQIENYLRMNIVDETAPVVIDRDDAPEDIEL